MKQLSIQDETMSGDCLHRATLQFEREVATVREIIEARVYEEVRSFNKEQKRPDSFLVEPTETERRLNGPRLQPSRTIDPEKQLYRALDGFQKNAFFILVNDRQVESLEEEVVVAPGTMVSFVRLTPLVGG